MASLYMIMPEREYDRLTGFLPARPGTSFDDRVSRCSYESTQDKADRTAREMADSRKTPVVIVEVARRWEVGSEYHGGGSGR